MRIIIYTLLVSLAFYGCNGSYVKDDKLNKEKLSIKDKTPNSQIDNRTDKVIEDLIVSSKGKLLFLSFWEGINDIDLLRVKQLETKKGNLKNGKFVILVPEESFHRMSSGKFEKIITNKEFPLTVNQADHSIQLKYEDEYWVKYEGDDPEPEEDGTFKGIEYDDFILYLINLFDEKYKRLKDKNNPNNLQWKKSMVNNQTILITLTPDFWYSAKFSDNSRFPNSQYKKEFEFGHSTAGFLPDKVNKRYCLAYSNIVITYENYDRHQRILRILGEQNKKKQIEQKKVLDINKNKL